MMKYDYCSGKEFAELVKDCLVSAVQTATMDVGTVDSGDAILVIKGMSDMAQLILHRLKVNREQDDG